MHILKRTHLVTSAIFICYLNSVTSLSGLRAPPPLDESSGNLESSSSKVKRQVGFLNRFHNHPGSIDGFLGHRRPHHPFYPSLISRYVVHETRNEYPDSDESFNSIHRRKKGYFSPKIRIEINKHQGDDSFEDSEENISNPFFSSYSHYEGESLRKGTHGSSKVNGLSLGYGAPPTVGKRPSYRSGEIYTSDGLTILSGSSEEDFHSSPEDYGKNKPFNVLYSISDGKKYLGNNFHSGDRSDEEIVPSPLDNSLKNRPHNVHGSYKFPSSQRNYGNVFHPSGRSGEILPLPLEDSLENNQHHSYKFTNKQRDFGNNFYSRDRSTELPQRSGEVVVSSFPGDSLTNDRVRVVHKSYTIKNGQKHFDNIFNPKDRSIESRQRSGESIYSSPGDRPINVHQPYKFRNRQRDFSNIFHTEDRSIESSRRPENDLTNDMPEYKFYISSSKETNFGRYFRGKDRSGELSKGSEENKYLAPSITVNIGGDKSGESRGTYLPQRSKTDIYSPSSEKTYFSPIVQMSGEMDFIPRTNEQKSFDGVNQSDGTAGMVEETDGQKNALRTSDSTLGKQKEEEAKNGKSSSADSTSNGKVVDMTTKSISQKDSVKKAPYKTNFRVHSEESRDNENTPARISSSAPLSQMDSKASVSISQEPEVKEERVDEEKLAKSMKSHPPIAAISSLAKIRLNSPDQMTSKGNNEDGKFQNITEIFSEVVNPKNVNRVFVATVKRNEANRLGFEINVANFTFDGFPNTEALESPLSSDKKVEKFVKEFNSKDMISNSENPKEGENLAEKSANLNMKAEEIGQNRPMEEAEEGENGQNKPMEEEAEGENGQNKPMEEEAEEITQNRPMEENAASPAKLTNADNENTEGEDARQTKMESLSEKDTVIQTTETESSKKGFSKPKIIVVTARSEKERDNENKRKIKNQNGEAQETKNKERFVSGFITSRGRNRKLNTNENTRLNENSRLLEEIKEQSDVRAKKIRGTNFEGSKIDSELRSRFAQHGNFPNDGRIPVSESNDYDRRKHDWHTNWSIEIPKTSFSCSDYSEDGYYSDVETACKVFHLCFEGTKSTFACPIGTTFSERLKVCVWAFANKCTKFESNFNIHRQR